MNIYDFIVKDSEGNDVSLSEYRGKVLIIVNTATQCGFTPQYGALQNLYTKYKDMGLEILDFPCDQFGHQAPGSDKEIKTFCEGRFGITFKQFKKVDVNGENQIDLFKYLKEQKGSLFGKDIKWNFTKFLIDRNGNVVKRFAPNVDPEKMESSIIKLLNI